MKKFIAGILAGIAVLALTLIALLLDPATFLQPHWKRTSIAIASFAIVCLVLQGIWTKRDEDAERKERERLYKQIGKVLNEAEKRQAARRRKATLTPVDAAREEAIKNAQALVEFLSSKEPTQKRTTLNVLPQLGGGVKLSMDSAEQELRESVIDALGEQLVKALDEGE